MQQQKIKIVAILLFSFSLNNLFAQEASSASGGNASGSGGFISYSIGQTNYITNTGSNGSVAQGVQQPYEISIVTALENTNDISLAFLVYPNPTTNFLKLSVRNYKAQNLAYQLYDQSGKLIENKKIESPEASISMENLTIGIYFLKVSELEKDLKTFKIIKN